MLEIGQVMALLAALGAAFAGMPAGAAVFPSSGALEFTVLRNGNDIGTHRIGFRRNGGALEVDVRTRIAVKIAFITVYRFEHDGHEVWRDDKLVAMETKTHDDGDDHSLVASANGRGQLTIVGDGKERIVEGSVIPASLWNHAVVDSTELLTSLVGTELAVEVVFKGVEPISVNGKSISASHYSMTGEFARELWYDEDRVLVRFAFEGKDGSDIQYVLH